MISSRPHSKRLHGPGPEVIREFSCSTQLDMKFQMLISMKISRKLACFLVQISVNAICPVHKC